MNFIYRCFNKGCTVLFTLIFFVIMSGCNFQTEQTISYDMAEEQKEDVYQPEETEKPCSENEEKHETETEVVLTVELPDNLTKFQNNGGTVVQYGEWTYYWEYHQDSVESSALFANYGWNALAENTLVRENSNGDKQKLYTGPGAGNIYIANDRLFLMAITDDAHGTGYVFSLTLTGQNYVDCGLGTICAADSDAGLIAILDEALDLYLLNVTTGKRTLSVKQADFLGWEDGVLYYQPHPDIAPENMISMWRLDIESGVCSELFSFKDPWRIARDDEDIGESAIRTIQITEEDIFFACGFYAGTMNVFQEGEIYRYNKRTGESEPVVIIDFEPSFYYFEDAGNAYLLYESDFQNMLFSFDDGTTSHTAMEVGKLYEPFKDAMGNYWVYSDISGKAVLLANQTANHNTALDVTPKQIACVGDRVFYHLVYSELDPAVSIGWRDGFHRVKTEVYCVDLNTMARELLYTY